MRESPSGRDLLLAVSMTTSQSSTPAAVKTALPPGGFESSVYVCMRVLSFDQCRLLKPGTNIFVFYLQRADT